MGRLVDLGLTTSGGLEGLISHPSVVPQLSLLPDLSDANAWIPMLLIPLAVQWWSSYYPGAEPGGGGLHRAAHVLCQGRRARGGGHLVVQCGSLCPSSVAMDFGGFGVHHVFPDLDALREAFPGIAEDKVGHDLAYPAMLSLLPSGLLGLVAASLLAAFMSTMSTQLNLGASYLVHDVYGRFMNPDASDRQKVWAGQISTGVSLVLGAGLGLLFDGCRSGFQSVALLALELADCFCFVGFGGAYRLQLKSLRWSFPWWWRSTSLGFTILADESIAFCLVPELGDWQKLVWGHPSPRRDGWHAPGCSRLKRTMF